MADEQQPPATTAVSVTGPSTSVTVTPPPQAPQALSGLNKYPFLEAVVLVAEPLTRVIVAVAITAGFMRLSLMKEISGDSYTNVFFIIIGFLFGRLETSATRPREAAPPPSPPPPKGGTP